MVFFRVADHPFQRAAAIFHRSWSERVARQAVLYIYQRESHLQVRKRLRAFSLFAPGDPSATVNKDDRGIRRAGLAAIDIQLQLSVVGDEVGDVRSDLVIGED